jgi:tRNA pseudouridine38/39 synthase
VARVLARFSAVHREYKYFIVQRGDLNLAAMQEAAGHFAGDHDFRNFCKVDAQHVSSFRRTILDFRVAPVGLQGAAQGGAQVYALHVRGTAFLWHQVIHFFALRSHLGIVLRTIA